MGSKIRITRRGGRIRYTNATPMPETVHGLPVGTTFDRVPIEQVVEDLIYPYQYPSFSAFAFGQSSPLECGVLINAGTKTWTWTSVNPSNVKANSIQIDDVTGSYNIGSGLADDGSEIISIPNPITKLTNAGTNVFRVTGTNTKEGTFTRNLTITWYAPVFYGVGAAGLTVAQLQSLSKKITGEVSFNADFTTVNQKIYIAYPAAWGNLSLIEDQNHFDITADFTKSTKSFTNNPGYYEGTTMDYYVYEYNNLTNLTNFKVYFNF